MVYITTTILVIATTTVMVVISTPIRVYATTLVNIRGYFRGPSGVSEGVVLAVERGVFRGGRMDVFFNTYIERKLHLSLESFLHNCIGG